MVILWMFCIFGNSLVCVVIQKSRRLQSTTNYFVVSLACSDLCFASCCIPFLLGDILAEKWIFGLVMCKFVRFMQWLVPFTSTSVLLSICIDRFYTIIYPLSFKVTRVGARRMILGSWSLGAILSCPTLYFYELENINGKQQCQQFISNNWDKLFYVIFVTILTFILPVIGITVGYSKVFRYIWRTGIGGRTFQRTTNPVPRAKVKMIKLIITVTYVVLIVMTPYFVINLWYSSSNRKAVNSSIFISMMWIYFSTTVTKPIIYFCFNINFKRGVKEVFCMNTMKWYRSNAYTITTASRLSKKRVGADPYGNDNRTIDSPTKTFDRSAVTDKCTWPLASPSPSTYL